MSGQTEFKATIEMVGTSGRPKSVTVTVVKEGTTLAKVLSEADVDPKNRDLLVDGKPASPDTLVTPNSEVKVVERPRGS